VIDMDRKGVAGPSMAKYVRDSISDIGWAGSRIRKISGGTEPTKIHYSDNVTMYFS